MVLGILLIIATVFVAGPVIDTAINDFLTTEEDISDGVSEGIIELESSEDPIKFSITNDSETNTYYIDRSEGKRVQLSEKETTKTYIVQTRETLERVEYGYEIPVYTNESTQKLSQTNPSNRVQYTQSLSKFDIIYSDYNLSTAVLKNTTNQEDSTIKTYEVTHKDNSDETVTVVLTDDKLTQIGFENMTVKIYYDAEEPKKPEPPEPDTDGEKEETT